MAVHTSTCGNQRWTSGIFLGHFPPYSLRHGLLLNPVLTHWLHWLARKLQGYTCFHSLSLSLLVLGLHVCIIMPVFHMGSGDPNLGPHALPDESLSPSPVICYFCWVYFACGDLSQSPMWKLQRILRVCFLSHLCQIVIIRQHQSPFHSWGQKCRKFSKFPKIMLTNWKILEIWTICLWWDSFPTLPVTVGTPSFGEKSLTSWIEECSSIFSGKLFVSIHVIQLACCIQDEKKMFSCAWSLHF